MIAKSFGEIPAAGPLEPTDQALLDGVQAAFGTVGELIGRHRQKAALAEAMRTVADVNKYVSDSAPWKLKTDDERERLGTILHVTAQAVADCNVLLSPFLPHSANAVDLVLGGAGDVAPMPEIREVDDLDGGPVVPDPDRRLLGLPGLGAQAGRPGHHGGEAGAGVHQARPLRGGRGARAARGPCSGRRRDAAPAGRRGARAVGAGPERRRPRLRAGRHRAAAGRGARGGRGRAARAGRPGRGRRRRRRALPALRARRCAAHDRVPARRRLRVRRGRHPRRRRHAGWRTGPARRCSPSTTGGRPEHRFPAAPDDVDTALSLAAGQRRQPRPRPGPRGGLRRQRRRQPRAGGGAAQPERAGRDRARLPVRRRVDDDAVLRRPGRRPDPRRGGLVLGAVRPHARRPPRPGPGAVPLRRVRRAPADAGPGRRARRAAPTRTTSWCAGCGPRAPWSRRRRTPG